jgi:hypothetical protein
MLSTRPLPDPHTTLHHARDYIFECKLTRKSLESSKPRLANFIADLLDATYKLSQACHLPEFTDHGLPHLCSLVDRVSRWEPANSKKSTLPDLLEPDEAAELLIALLVHDLGMLSQKPEDLPQPCPPRFDPSQWANHADWVRRTHVLRLSSLLPRLMIPYSDAYKPLFDVNHESNLLPAIDIAKAHQEWPWDWKGDWASNRRRALASVVSVADLLDEDAGRCDTETLLEHRGGDELNRAHWLRHVLTADRLLIINGAINIDIRRPPRTGETTKPIYSALRNHFRLISLYEQDLKSINAEVKNINLTPSTGVPTNEATTLENWNSLSGFSTESALTYQLMRTFMPESLKDEQRCGQGTLDRLRIASLEDVDLKFLRQASGKKEPRSPFEQTFEAMIGGKD